MWIVFVNGVDLYRYTSKWVADCKAEEIRKYDYFADVRVEYRNIEY